MRKILTTMITILMMSIVFMASAAADENIKIMINGEEIISDIAKLVQIKESEQDNKEEDKTTEETGSSEDSKPSDNTSSKSPLTGDNSGLFQWIVLLAISILGVGVLWKKRASVK